VRGLTRFGPFSPSLWIPLLLALVPLWACRSHIYGVSIDSGDGWRYPVKLGDTRERVSEVLSYPSRETPSMAEYPKAGVTAWFDQTGRVSKLAFLGEASRLYTSDPVGIFPIRPPIGVVFTLTGESTEADFRKVLGNPATEAEVPARGRERRRIWKSRGYVIEGLFLVEAQSEAGKTYQPGTLVWFEVTRGL